MRRKAKPKLLELQGEALPLAPPPMVQRRLPLIELKCPNRLSVDEIEPEVVQVTERDLHPDLIEPDVQVFEAGEHATSAVDSQFLLNPNQAFLLVQLRQTGLAKSLQPTCYDSSWRRMVRVTLRVQRLPSN